MRVRVAVIDDWQNVAEGCADWSALKARAELVFFQRSFPEGTEAEAEAELKDFDIILPMRERSTFLEPMLQHLPRLKMISATGGKTPHIALDHCTRQGIAVSYSIASSHGYAAEMALALMLAAARKIPMADSNMRAGRFQDGIGLGIVLRGRTLGIVGLGKIGVEMATYAKALGMKVLAWSQNLTPEKATAGGAEYVSKERLLEESDVVTLHLVLSNRTRGILGRDDLARMRAGAILVNTGRGPLVDEAALLDAVRAGKIIAALDVYGEEPLPADHPIRHAPNTVLAPHLGFSTEEVFRDFYQGAIDNIVAVLDGKPAKLLNPDVTPKF